MDLSIIILNWNTRSLLLECLAELKQELDRLGEEPSREVIVVDNGSTDDSASRVRVEFPWVDLIALDRNRGFAAGNNVALRKARGDTVLLLNTDVVLEAGAITTCLDALESRSDAGAAGLQLIHPDGRLQNSIHAFPSFWTELFPTALLEILAPREFPSKRYRHTSPIEVDAVQGAVLFVRRGVLERVGLLPEDYFFFLEETDWCWQMRESGYRVLHVPTARATHLSGASSKKKDPVATRIEYQRSLYRFLRRRRGALSARAVEILRVFKSLLILPALLILAVFSPRRRRRLRTVVALLHWHFRGCPEDWGGIALDSNANLGRDRKESSG